jgi:hypothetical protein
MAQDLLCAVPGSRSPGAGAESQMSQDPLQELRRPGAEASVTGQRLRWLSKSAVMPRQANRGLRRCDGDLVQLLQLASTPEFVTQNKWIELLLLRMLPAVTRSWSEAASRMEALQINCNWCSDCSWLRSSKPQCSALSCALKALHSTVGKAYCCANSCSKTTSKLRKGLLEGLPSSRSRSSTARNNDAGPLSKPSQACSKRQARVSSRQSPGWILTTFDRKHQPGLDRWLHRRHVRGMFNISIVTRGSRHPTAVMTWHCRAVSHLQQVLSCCLRAVFRLHQPLQMTINRLLQSRLAHRAGVPCWSAR